MLIHFVFGIGGILIGLITGIFLEKTIVRSKNKRIIEGEKALFEQFGSPIIINNVNADDVYEWINNHKKLINNGKDIAVVFKANSNLFEGFENIIKDIQKINNYLIVGIYGYDKKFKESILIKYEQIDDSLETLLKKGNGMLIVTMED